MYSIQVSKNILNIEKLISELKTITSDFLFLNKKGSELDLFFNNQLTQNIIDQILNQINNFIEIDVTEQIQTKLVKEIDPWIKSFLARTRAENIENGITQLGLTLVCQSFFEKKYDLNNSGFSVSMMGILYSGSLTLMPPLIDFILSDHLSDLSATSPIITSQRLLDWKQEVIDFLTGE